MFGRVRCGLHKSTERGNGTRAGHLRLSGRAGRHHLHPCKRRLTGVSALPHQNPGRPSTGCLGVPEHGRAVQLWTTGSMCQTGGWGHHSPMTPTGDRLSHPGPPRIAPGRHCSFMPVQLLLNRTSFVAKTKARLPSVILDIFNRGSSVFVFVARTFPDRPYSNLGQEDKS